MNFVTTDTKILSNQKKVVMLACLIAIVVSITVALGAKYLDLRKEIIVEEELKAAKVEQIRIAKENLKKKAGTEDDGEDEDSTFDVSEEKVTNTTEGEK